MDILLIIVLLALAGAAAYFFLRSKKTPNTTTVSTTKSDRAQAKAGQEKRIHGIRRSGHDKREAVRFEPEKTPRRIGSGRREEDKLWDKEN